MRACEFMRCVCVLVCVRVCAFACVFACFYSCCCSGIVNFLMPMLVYVKAKYGTIKPWRLIKVRAHAHMHTHAHSIFVFRPSRSSLLALVHTVYVFALVSFAF